MKKPIIDNVFTTLSIASCRINLISNHYIMDWNHNYLMSDMIFKIIVIIDRLKNMAPGHCGHSSGQM